MPCQALADIASAARFGVGACARVGHGYRDGYGYWYWFTGGAPAGSAA